MTQVDKARDAGKYLFVWDKQGSVATFFKYKGHLAEIHRELIKVSLGRSTTAEVTEFLRKNLVISMRNGDRLMLDLNELTCDLKDAYKDPAVFDAEIVFNYAEWAKEENYIRYVKEDENHGIGGLNPGHYFRSEHFSLTVRSGAPTEDILQEQIAKIPRFDSDFIKITIV